jgi:hypothetical protein
MLYPRMLLAFALVSSLFGCVAEPDGALPPPRGDTSPPPAAPDEPADGVEPDDEGEQTEQDVDEATATACAAPIGTYEYTVDPHLLSGPCSEPTSTGAVVSVETTQDHTFLSNSGVSCTVSATELADNGCTRTDLLRCADGTSMRTVCEMNADGSVFDCVSTTERGHLACEFGFEATRTSERSDCTPIGGVYHASITRVAGDDAAGCMASSKLEMTDAGFKSLLTRTTACRWNEPSFADDFCSLSRDAECPEADRASLDCSWNTDSTEVRCELVAGVCAYDLSLVR